MKKENYSIDFYKAQLEKLSTELQKYSLRTKLWVLIRLFSFISIVLLAYFTFPYTLLSTFTLLVSVVLFLYFVRRSAENTEKYNYIKLLIKINENEIKCSLQDYTPFRSGVEYIDPEHPFSYDMDVFGNRSFFQLFNRTVTHAGERKLVSRLLEGIENTKESVEAIDELTNHKEWYQGYLAHGDSLEKEESEISISNTIRKEFNFKSWIKVVRFLLPVLALSISVAYYFDFLNGFQFLIGAFLLMIPVRQTLKTTNELHSTLSKLGKRAAAMSKQLEIMETVNFQSALLKEYHKELFHQKKSGQQGLKELSQLIKETEYRDNILVAIFLNFYFAWDFRLLIKYKKWKNNYEQLVGRWEEIVYEMEALISGANFKYNFSNHTVAPILTQNGEETIRLIEIGHPIIPLKKLVKNNFELSSAEQFAIITGPNMAGKSTFLRSIGINLMLARAGFHVFAKEFTFPNMKLYSSMRTSDDLKDETSYFHAELLRLRFIMDAIERKEKVFIILDEILKGTNSKDKEEGSSKFLQKLNQLQVKGIIATHDLSLTDLARDYPSIINKYFDTEINGDDISFDYTIRNGVAKNMNASFLLRKMGLIDN